MELTPLRYFAAIARHGHLTKAARELGVTQPALSAMLKKLEREVGAQLLHRGGRQVELTQAGAVFLTHAQDSVRQADAGLAAVRQLLGMEAGSIRIGAGATAAGYLLPGVVSSLSQRHPGLRFTIREAGSLSVASSVLAGELDLGVVTLPISLPDADRLIKTPLVTDELRLIVPGGGGKSERASERTSERGKKDTRATSLPISSPSFARALVRSLAPSPTFRWRDLDHVPFVAFEGGTAVRELIDREAAKAGVSLNVVMELRSIESIKQMVAAGIGVALVSRFAIGASTPWGDGAACKDGKLGRELAIVQRRDRAPGPAAAALIKEMQAHVRGRTADRSP